MYINFKSYSFTGAPTAESHTPKGLQLAPVTFFTAALLLRFEQKVIQGIAYSQKLLLRGYTRLKTAANLKTKDALQG